MLAAAVHLGLNPRGYERPDHPLQVMIAGIISETCGVRLERDGMGVDGCSLPTWSLPLGALARGFARLGSGEGLAPARAAAVTRLIGACFAAPELVAGEGRFDTIAMRALAPALFVKGGAEGVHCAALPKLGLGVALKVDDGAKRGRRTGARRAARGVSARGAARRWPISSTARCSIGAASASDGGGERQALSAPSIH